MTLYRVMPPKGLALPDVHPSPEAANMFFRLHYYEKGECEWYYLQTVRPLQFSDFIYASMISGPMKEVMAENGIDDSHLPDGLGLDFEDAARAAIDIVAESAGVEIPGYKVLEQRRVDYPN